MIRIRAGGIPTERLKDGSAYENIDVLRKESNRLSLGFN